MCRQARAINRAQIRFQGSPEKGRINSIWDSSRMWQCPRGGNSELGLAKYTEILHVGPRGCTQLFQVKGSCEEEHRAEDSVFGEQSGVLLNHKV